MASKLGKSFKDAYSDWSVEEKAKGLMPEAAYGGAERFAEWLDRFQFLTPQLQVLAMIQARRVDAELISALIDVVGTEKATEIARGIQKRYQVTPQAPALE